MNKQTITRKEFVSYIESPEYYTAIDNGFILDACHYNYRSNRIEISWTETDQIFVYYFSQFNQKQEVLKVVDGEIVELTSDEGPKFAFRFLKAVKL